MGNATWLANASTSLSPTSRRQRRRSHTSQTGKPLHTLTNGPQRTEDTRSSLRLTSIATGQTMVQTSATLIGTGASAGGRTRRMLTARKKRKTTPGAPRHLTLFGEDECSRMEESRSISAPAKQAKKSRAPRGTLRAPFCSIRLGSGISAPRQCRRPTTGFTLLLTRHGYKSQSSSG